MTPAKFASYVRYKTRTNTTTFPDVEMLNYKELRQEELAGAILDVHEDFFLVPQLDDLVADQREYPFPADILSRIKRVEAKLDETDFIPLSEIDINEVNFPIATETDITNVFNNLQVSKNNPNGARFDIMRKSIYIYSATITSVTDGIKLWCSTYPAVVTDLTSVVDLSVDPSTTTHGMPKAMHRVWATGVIIDYKESRQKPIPLSEGELAYEFNKQKAIKVLKHGNLDREVIGKLPPPSDRGNEGADF